MIDSVLVTPTETEQLPFQADYDSTRRLFSEAVEAVESNPAFSPFEKSLVSNVLSPNEDFAPGTAFYNRLRTLFGASDPSDDDMFDIGIDIGSHLEETNGTPRKLMLGYLSACKEVDAIKCGAAGTKAKTDVMNTITGYMQKQIAPVLATHKRFAVIEKSIVDALAAVEANAGDLSAVHAAQWLNFKQVVLTQETQAIGNFGTFTEKLYQQSGITVEGSATTEDVIYQTRLLTKHAMERRQYGIKPAAIDAKIGGSWLFYDGDYYAKQYDHTNASIKDVAAVVMHTPHTKFKDLRMQFEEHVHGPARTASVSIGKGAVEPDFTLYIDTDGRISLDREGLTPLSLALKEKPAIAKALIAEIGSNFFDLVMPVEQTNIAAKRQDNVDPKDKALDPIIDLLAPRIQRLNRNKPNGSSDIISSVREHDVVWHIRKLPSGWRPSPEALLHAQRNGIVLGEHETFVKAHKRGKENPVLGHHIVKSSGIAKPRDIS